MYKYISAYDARYVVVLSSLINGLKLKGFVNFGRAPLSSQEIDELIQLSRITADRLSPDHPHLSNIGSLTAALQCLPQHHPRNVKLLDSVFSNPDIQSVLKSALGPDYKIWQIIFRQAMPCDKGLYLHQDSSGEFGLFILASENSG